jgi:hypothetical protein
LNLGEKKLLKQEVGRFKVSRLLFIKFEASAAVGVTT